MAAAWAVVLARAGGACTVLAVLCSVALGASIRAMTAWTDRSLLVTGGTGALGRAVSVAALERGAHLTVTYFDRAEADDLIAALAPAQRDRVRLVEIDLRKEDAVHGLFYGMSPVDAAIHLCGGFMMAAVESISLATFREHHDLNATTTFLVCKHAVQRMRERGSGRIVTVASRAAVDPGAGLAAYASSKAAVIAITKVVAAETIGTDITANCVLPSIIDTPANRSAMPDQEPTRWVSPASLAEVILFLASDEARDLRGATLPVYGNV